MIRNFLLQFIKRLQYVAEENKPRAIEFNNDNYQDLLNVQISVVYIDGEECEVVLYDENGNRYRSNYRTSITIENLYKICPVIQESLFVCCKWKKGNLLASLWKTLIIFPSHECLSAMGLFLVNTLSQTAGFIFMRDVEAGILLRLICLSKRIKKRNK